MAEFGRISQMTARLTVHYPLSLPLRTHTATPSLSFAHVGTVVNVSTGVQWIRMRVRRKQDIVLGGVLPISRIYA